MKKIFLIFFVLLIFTVSCNFNKEPISSEKFKSVMEKNGFSIENINIPQSSENFEVIVKEVLIAKNSNYQIEFFVADNSDKAVRIFQDNKEKFMSSKVTSYSESNKDSGNKSKYTLKANSKFKVAYRIENTLIYIDAPGIYEKNIERILKELEN